MIKINTSAKSNSSDDNRHTLISMNKKMLLLPLLCGAILVTSCHSDGNSSDEPKNPDQEIAYTDDLKLLSYNVYLMNKLISDWSADKRAEFIGQSDVIKGHDVIILNELFDDGSSEILLSSLRAEYPNQTPILAREYSEEALANGSAGTNSTWNQSLGNITKQAFEDGGVAIISRWPIKEQIEYVYKDGCGTDNYGKKGFVYALINKNGADYHVIGTHAQSEDSACDVGSDAIVRKSQFTELQQFITAKNIPVNEILFIGGDFNVIKDSAEYPDMLQTLDVNAPDSYAGFDSSWDPESNAIASHNYPDLSNQYLDYIFVSKKHAQPTYWHNQSIDETSPRWESDGRYFNELSDHYPISAFSYADEKTRTESYRFINRPYADIQLRNKDGMYLKLANAGKLSMTGTTGENTNSFNLDNRYPKNQASCIKNNDFVQLQSNVKTGNYLNATEDFTYNTQNDSAENLRIEILNDTGSCLKNGDKIVFLDKNKDTGKDEYVKQDMSNQTNGLILSSDGKESAVELTVEMQAGKIDDWTDKLKYNP